MLNNINFDNPSPHQGSDINFTDWDIPSAPSGRSISPRWGDSFNLSAPTGSAGNKPFPEYAVIDPNNIHEMMQSLATSFDVGVGAAKKVIPGLAGVGDFLGGVGHTIDTSPAAKPLGMFKDAVTSIGTDLLGAVTRRGSQIIDQYGKTLVDDPWTSIMNVLSLPTRVALTAGLGETGTKLAHGQFDFSTAPRDVLDSIEIASFIPAFRAAGLLMKGEALGPAGLFAKGFTRPLEGGLEYAGLVQKAGQIAGRVTLATEGLGLAAEFALPKIAPDAKWAQEILSNRVVAEDSPWRFPFEAATSLPLDLVGLYKFGAESRLAEWASVKTFGPAKLPTQIHFGNDILDNAVKGGIITNKELNIVDDFAFRQTAEDALVRAWNASHAGEAAESIKDLPFSQAEAAQKIKNMVQTLEKQYGRKEFSQMAADVMATQFEGWENLTHAEQLQQFKDYSELALAVETQFPHTTIAVANDIIHFRLQAPEAFDYLRDAIAAGRPGNEVLNSIKNRFPAMADKIKESAGDHINFEKALIGIVGGNADALPSLRAQLREAEARASKMLSDFDQTASKAPAQTNVKFMVTKADEAALRSKGYTQAEINAMRPEEAQRLLGNDAFADTGARQAGAVNDQSDQVLGRYSKQLTDEIKNIDDLTVKIGLAEKPTLGTMQSMLDTLNARIVKGDFAVAGERNTLIGKIKAIREEMAQDINKQILTLEDSMFARESELAQAAGQEADYAVVDAEWENMRQEASRLSRKYYETRMAGSRWEVTMDSRTPIMRLADDTGIEWTRAERTGAGKVFDKLFAGIPNKEIIFEAKAKFENMLAGKGNSAQDIKKYMEELTQFVDDSSTELSSGFRISKYGSVYHLPPTELNNIAKRVGIQVGDSTASEMMYRSFPGPLKIFQEQVLGKSIDIPYNAVFHNITRSLYPQLRFYLSPRFIAMNLFESQIIGGASGGAKFFAGQADENLVRMAQRMAEKESFDAYDKIGVHMSRNIAKAVMTKRPDEFVKGVLDTVWAQPEMASVAKELGTKDKWYKELSTLMQDREAVMNYKASMTTAEQTIAAQIEKVKLDLHGGIGSELMNRSELERLSADYTTAVVDRKASEVAESAFLKGNAKYQPFLDNIKVKEEKMIEDMRHAFVGNPSRSAMERLGNSFMVYWPLSYQIKATKVLVEFLSSRAFGFQTGSLGMATYNHIQNEHNMKMENDPEYAAFFNNNKEMAFLMRQMLPITPEDIGVSLSPFVRVPYHMAKGDMTAAQGVTRLGTVGPTYDVSLFSRILSEQSKPGGVFFDLFNSGN